MTESPINLFDLAVILIVGLSALLSFFRGFMREVLSLGTWIGASIITLIALPTVSKFVEPQVKSVPLSTAISSVGTFLTALVVISIGTNMLVKFVKAGPKIGLLDNLLGLGFGVARGVLIVAICYFVMTIVVAEKDYPKWIKDAHTRPEVEKVSKVVARLTTDSLDVLTKKEDPAKAKERAEHKDDYINNLIKKADEEANERRMPTMKDLQHRMKEENEKQ